VEKESFNSPLNGRGGGENNKKKGEERDPKKFKESNEGTKQNKRRSQVILRAKEALGKRGGLPLTKNGGKSGDKQQRGWGGGGGDGDFQLARQTLLPKRRLGQSGEGICIKTSRGEEGAAYSC